MRERANDFDATWALGMFAVGLVVFWLTRRRWRIPYFSNTWWWGLFPLPNIPAFAVLAMAGGGLGLLAWLLEELFPQLRGG